MGIQEREKGKDTKQRNQFSTIRAIRLLDACANALARALCILIFPSLDLSSCHCSLFLSSFLFFPILFCSFRRSVLLIGEKGGDVKITFFKCDNKNNCLMR